MLLIAMLSKHRWHFLSRNEFEIGDVVHVTLLASGATRQCLNTAPRSTIACGISQLSQAANQEISKISQLINSCMPELFGCVVVGS